MAKNIYKFDNNLELAVEKLEANNWKIDAGATSNCTDHYNVIGVAIHTDGHVTTILKSSSYSGRYVLVPSDFTELNGKLVALGNYGTPQAASGVEESIWEFNSVYNEENCRQDLCRIRPITKIVWKDGRIWEAA